MKNHTSWGCLVAIAAWAATAAWAALERPVPGKTPPPDYPPLLQGSGLVGQVLLEFEIDKTGHTREPVVVESNNPWFERAAVRALDRWMFKPGKVDGLPTAMRFRQLFRFTGRSLFNGEQPLWRIFRSSQVDNLPEDQRWQTPPEPVSTSFPLYPLAAALAYRTGYVNALMDVDEEGNLTSVRIMSSSDDELAGTVKAALETWAFKPARRADGSAVKCTVSYNHDYAPSGQKSSLPMLPGAEAFLALLRQPGTPAILPAAQLDAIPRAISRRSPRYPRALWAKGVEGSALIEFYVDTLGDVQFPHVIEASEPEFGYAAAHAVASWFFDPPRLRGKPVATVMRVSFPFHKSPQ